MRKPEEEAAEVVRLPTEPPPPAPPSPHRAAHGLVVTLMSAFALLGILATLAFITVGWPDNVARAVRLVIALAVVGFVASASIAVFTAARGSYSSRDRDE